MSHQLVLLPIVAVFLMSTHLVGMESESLAKQVKIFRDEWGVAHVVGITDMATLFGAGYAQSEDYFWQLEDNCIRGAGRYAEVYGEKGLRSDLLNRAFEIPRRSQEDFAAGEGEHRRLVSAFVAGINFYLKTHPNVRPRLINRFEPWHILAMDRHFIADFTYGRAHVDRPQPIPADAAAQLGTPDHPISIASWSPLLDAKRSKLQEEGVCAIGSNQWAISPSKTNSGNAMLFINPHQPWHGWGQFHEIHLHSKETLRFSGAGFLGSPIPSIGHNDALGWTYTVNEPDIADAWNLTFDHPADHLKYRYAGKYRDAVTWNEAIRVKTPTGTESRVFEFRRSHFGPVVRQIDETTFQAVRIGRLFDMERGRQAFSMIRASNFEQWRQAASSCAIPMFNIAYADREGNIFYIYNGAIPKRSPDFDWQRPVDGSDPRTEWQGFHAFAELPQVLNPPSGYVQNCNSTPFTTTDDGNPSRNDFPEYLAEDRDDDKRRAKVSRMLLRKANNLDLEQLEKLAFDTTLYWPLTEVPRFQRDWNRLNQVDPKLADEVKPLLDHLTNWDFQATVESTQTALCLAWYEELYGLGYPAETLKPEYQADRLRCFAALKKAGDHLKRLHGDWKVRWGKAHRLQRVRNKADIVSAAVTFNRFRKSFELPGAPGPLGVVFTIYSTPSIPIVRPERYAVVGSCYMAVVEFGDRVTAKSITPFGTNSNPRSANYVDQSELFAQRKFKPAWYYEEEIEANAKRSYSPGETR